IEIRLRDDPAEVAVEGTGLLACGGDGIRGEIDDVRVRRGAHRLDRQQPEAGEQDDARPDARDPGYERFHCAIPPHHCRVSTPSQARDITGTKEGTRGCAAPQPRPAPARLPREPR